MTNTPPVGSDAERALFHAAAQKLWPSIDLTIRVDGLYWENHDNLWTLWQAARSLPVGARHEPEPFEMPDDKDIFAFINDTPLLQSLLYDINLLPEQIRDPQRWRYMVAVCAHFDTALSANGSICGQQNAESEPEEALSSINGPQTADFTAPQAPAAPGMRLVPVEPTPEMQQAAMAAWMTRRPFPEVYQAMLSAIPADTGTVEGREPLSEPDALVITMTKHGQAVREVTANIMIDHARTPEEYLEGLVTGMYCSLKKRIEEAAHNIQPPSGGIQEVK